MTVRIIQGDDDLFKYAFLCKLDIMSAFIAGFSSIPFFFLENPLIINDFTISFLSIFLLKKVYPAHIFTGSEHIKKKCAWVNCGHLTCGHLVTNASIHNVFSPSF